MAIRVLIVDDHKLMRQGLIKMIAAFGNIEVVGEAATGQQAIELAKELSPDLILMDIAMPEKNGIEATRQIKKENRDINIIGLSMYSDAQSVAEMLKCGASGYLYKDCSPEDLQGAITSVLHGEVYLSPAIASKLVNEYIVNDVSSNQSAYEALTDREREIMQLISEGFRTKEIATKLDVSIKTVDTHRHNIQHKLGLFSVAEIVKYAVREGITSLEVTPRESRYR
jgi:DNA-binding NarL/FixJ family response regulator